MSSLIQQTNFSLGEVDEVLEFDTNQPQYLQALSKLDNAFVGGYTIPIRRPSFVDCSLSLTDTEHDRRSMSFQDKSGGWYTLHLRGNNTTRIHLIKYSLNDLTVLVPTAQTTLATDTGVMVTDYDFTATDNYVVITTPSKPPRKITVNATALDSSTIEDIKFSVLPSLDYGDVDYSSFTFHPLCSNGSVPTGNPLVCNPSSVFGGVIDVVRPLTGDPTFTSDWVGGLIVGRTGASAEQPIGVGIITAISTTNPTKQRLTVTVLQAFGTAHFSTTGPTWSVRKPLWGTRSSGALVYPAKTSFFKGRLWFANTSELPMMVSGSVQNSPANFNVGQGESPDAIAYILQNSEGGGIKHIFGGQNLHVFTATQQLTIQGGLDVGIDPANFSPQVTSSYTTSSLKPILYRNGIYFTTSDGRAVVEMVESDRQVSTGIISTNSQHLIKSPKAAAVVTIPNTQDQVLALLNNDDHTLVVFSSAPESGVRSFSSYNVSNVNDELTEDITAVDNRFYITSSRERRAYAGDDVDFDYRHDSTMSMGVFTVEGTYDLAQIVGVTYETTVNGNTNHNYVGEFPVIDVAGTKSVDIGDSNISAHVRYGKSYTTTIRSLPLFSSASGSFLKRRVTQFWCQFSNSYNFTVNGVATALMGSSGVQPTGEVPYMVTGTKRIGFGTSYRQDTYVTIIQSTPYPVNVQKLAWVIEEKVII